MPLPARPSPQIIFFCIYAILAVELFSPFGQNGDYPIHWQSLCETENGTACAELDQETVSSMTARGYTNGYEYYGTFSRALFTLFQVMTGESWSEAIARPLIFGWDANSFVAAAFFVSFIILTQIVLINVVVAVLLDKFSSGPEEEIEEKVDLAELVNRMDAKESEAIYLSKKDEGINITVNLIGGGGTAPAAQPPLEIVKMPPSIAKLPTDKGDIDQILQLLKRMEARISVIEQASTVLASPSPTRLPPPAASTSPGSGTSSPSLKA